MTGDVLDVLQVDLFPNTFSTQAEFNEGKGQLLKILQIERKTGHGQEG